MADPRDQVLRARVDPQPLTAERQDGPVAKPNRRRELAQPRLSDRERQAGVVYAPSETSLDASVPFWTPDPLRECSYISDQRVALKRKTL